METLLKTDTYTVGLVPTSFLGFTSHYPSLRSERERETDRRENLGMRLGSVAAFLCPFLLTVNKTDISQRWTLVPIPTVSVSERVDFKHFKLCSCTPIFTLRLKKILGIWIWILSQKRKRSIQVHTLHVEHGPSREGGPLKWLGW